MESIAISPAAPWVGGKIRLAKTIIPMIEAIPHVTYAEPFVGMGGIFLRRRHAAKAEIINDYSRDVSNFFRILQRHYVAFLDMLRYQLTMRAEFERLLAVDPDTLTDLERAARFLYLQRTVFGGKPGSRSFGVSIARPARFDVTKLVPVLEDIHSRLSGVVIERLSYEHFMPKYDRADTLFYLDPPYYGCEDYYGKEMFSRADFSRLAALLRGIKGKFLLSLNDVPEVREIFSDFRLIPVRLKYSVNAQGATDAQELIITNQEKLAVAA